DILLARLRLALEQLGRHHDHAVGAIAALRRLFVDERLLQRVRLLDGAKTLERRDLLVADIPDRRHAGTRRFCVEQYRTGAALPKAASEFGPIEPKVVAKDVEQGRVGLGRDRVALAVDLDADGHGGFVSFASGRSDRL